MEGKNGLPSVALMSSSFTNEPADLQPIAKAFLEESPEPISILKDAVAEKETAALKTVRSKRRRKKRRYSSYYPLTRGVVRRNANPSKKNRLFPTNSLDLSKPPQSPSCDDLNIKYSLRIPASSQEAQKYSAFNLQRRNFTGTVADVKKRKKIQREFKNLLSGKVAAIDDKRSLRPRGPPKLNKATLLKHLREVKICEADGERVVGRRIKVYWPLDDRWYYGTVLSYDGPRKLHKIVYDDCQEELLALAKEKFKLQVSPGEVFGPTNSVQQETKSIHGDKRSDMFRKKTSMWVEGNAQVNTHSDLVVNVSQRDEIGEQRALFTQHGISTSFQIGMQNPQVKDISDNNARSKDSETRRKIVGPKTTHVYFRRRKKASPSNKFIEQHNVACLSMEGACVFNHEAGQPDIIESGVHNMETATGHPMLREIDRYRVPNKDIPVDQTCDTHMVVVRHPKAKKTEALRTRILPVMEESSDAMVIPLVSPSLTEQNEETGWLSSLETEGQTNSSVAEFTDILQLLSCRRLVRLDLPTDQTISFIRKHLALTRVNEKKENLTSRIQPALRGCMPTWNLKKAFRLLVNILNSEHQVYDLVVGRLFHILNSMDISISAYDLCDGFKEVLIAAVRKRMPFFDWRNCRQITVANNELSWKKFDGGYSILQHYILAPTGINHMTFQQIVDVFVCSLFKPSIWASLSHSSTVTTSSLQDFLNYDKGGQLEVASLYQRWSIKPVALGFGSLRVLERPPHQVKLLEKDFSGDCSLFLNCGSKETSSITQQFDARTSELGLTNQTQVWRLLHASDGSEVAEPSYSNVDNHLLLAGIHNIVTDSKNFYEEERNAVLQNPTRSDTVSALSRALHLRRLFQKRYHIFWEDGHQILAREIRLKLSKATQDNSSLNLLFKPNRRCMLFSLNKDVKISKGWKRSFSHFIESESSEDHLGTCDIKRFKEANTSGLIPQNGSFEFARKAAVQMEFEDEPVESAELQHYSLSNISGLPLAQVHTAAEVQSKALCSSLSKVADGNFVQSAQSQLDWLFNDAQQQHESFRASFNRVEDKVLPGIFEQYGTIQLPMNRTSYSTLEHNSIGSANQMNQRASLHMGRQWSQKKATPTYRSRIGHKKRKRDTFTSVNSDGSQQPQLFARRGRPKKQEMVSEGLPSSCTANILIIDYDKCWREIGATIELQLLNDVEWVISAKVQGGNLYMHKVQPSAPTGTTNRYTHSMMWKGGNNWTLEFSDRRQWSSFKRIYEECCQKNARAAFLKHIPVPGVREISNSSIDVIGSKFVRPTMEYIHEIMGYTDAALVSSHIVYDMDSEDERWICNINNNRAIVGTEASISTLWISEEVFERIIDRLEKVSFKQQHEPVPEDVAVDVCDGLSSADVIKAVHAYWMIKRQAKRMALVRHFQPAPWEIYQKQLQEWQACNSQSQLHLPPAGTSLLHEVRKGPPLFAFCLRPRRLEVVNKNKMQKQKSQKKLSSGYGLFQRGASPTGSSCERVYGEELTDHSSSKDLANSLGEAESFSGGSTFLMDKQPVNSEPCFPSLNSSKQKSRTRKKRRKDSNMGGTVTSKELRQKQQLFQMQHVLTSLQHTNSDWQLRSNSGAGTMLQSEADGTVGVFHTTLLRPSLDPFTNASQIQAKATAARLRADRKREEAYRRFLMFDLSLKKAVDAVIELEAIQAAGDSTLVKVAGSQLSSAKNSQLGSMQKVDLCNEHATTRRNDMTNSSASSWPVPNGDFSKTYEESGSNIIGNDFQSADIKHIDSDITLLPVASWSKELDAGLGTVLIQNTEKGQETF